MNYIENMTDEQSDAIMSEEELVIVKAGAGTGKTRVLINRAKRLDDSGYSVLLTTFTRAARREIQERMNILGANSVTIYTLNSLAWRMAGCPELISDNEKGRIMRELILKHGMVLPSTLLGDDNEKDEREKEKITNEMLRIIDRFHAYNVFGYHEQIQNKAIRMLLVEWDAICEERRLFDKTTIFKLATQRIKQNPELCVWEHILIDESQDLSQIQYEFIRLLAENKKLFMVGDPDQSIYGFRAAIPGFMTENFYYSGYNSNDIDIISLTNNYRCTHQILNPAINCINSISYRSTPKKLIAQRDGDLLRINKFPNEKLEANYIVDKIEALLTAGIPYDEIAVLARLHKCVNAVISELSRRHIPYIQMGSAFMDRPEVIILQSIINVLLNPDDYESSNIIYKGFFKSKEDLPRVHQYGSYYLCLINSIGKGKNKNYIIEKFDVLFQMLEQNISPEIIFNRIIEWLDIRKIWRDKKGFRFLTHSLSDLISMSQEAETLREMAMDLETRRYEMEGASKSKDAIFVGTIFSSKGLEFEHVFIPSVYLGTFPNQRVMSLYDNHEDPMYSISSDGDIDEEKRLLYVGITRAMKSCTITWPSKRGYGKYSNPTAVSPLLLTLKVRLP